MILKIWLKIVCTAFGIFNIAQVSYNTSCNGNNKLTVQLNSDKYDVFGHFDAEIPNSRGMGHCPKKLKQSPAFWSVVAYYANTMDTVWSRYILYASMKRVVLSAFEYLFTFPLRVFKWTSTFETWFIPSWTNRFKPHPHTRHLNGLTSSPSNNVACLLTFVRRWTHITMTLSAEIWRFGYSKPNVMSDLIQNM